MNMNDLLPDGYAIDMTPSGWRLLYNGDTLADTYSYKDAFRAMKGHHGMSGRERIPKTVVILEHTVDGCTVKLTYDETWKDYSIERDGAKLFCSEDETSAVYYYVDLVAT